MKARIILHSAKVPCGFFVTVAPSTQGMEFSMKISGLLSFYGGTGDYVGLASCKSCWKSIDRNVVRMNVANTYSFSIYAINWWIL